MKKKYPERISVRLDSKTSKKLNYFSQATGMSISWLVRQTLKYGLDPVLTSLREEWRIKLEERRRNG